MTAVTETLNGVRERSAAGYIGWPPARLAGRLRGQPPARKATAADAGDTAQAQRSDIDNAITAFADEVGGSLPEPWLRTVREAARSRADEAQAVLGVAVAGGLPPRDKVTGWWRLVALAQWLLMALSLVGVVWIVVILAAHGGHKSSSLVSDVSLAPWLGVMVAALLLLGWLIASWCQNMVVLAADREREQAVHAVMARIATATSDLVLVPTGRELGRIRALPHRTGRRPPRCADPGLTERAGESGGHVTAGRRWLGPSIRARRYSVGVTPTSSRNSSVRCGWSA